MATQTRPVSQTAYAGVPARAPAPATAAFPFLTSAPLVPWSLDFTSAVFPADLNGDGVDELIAVNGTSIGVLSHFDYSDISPNWSGGWGGLHTLAISRMTVSPGSNQTAYALSSLDQIQTMTLNTTSGVPTQGLVIHNPGVSICVVSWTGSALNVSYLSAGMIKYANGSSGWVLNPTDQLYVADVNGDGVDELIMHNACSPNSANYIGVLQWTNSQLQTLWLSPQEMPVGRYCNSSTPWYLGAADVYTVADVDGDGMEEVVILARSGNGNAGWVGVLKWDNYNSTTYQLQTYWDVTTTIPESTQQSGAWPIGPSDQILRVRHAGAGDYLLFYNPGSAKSTWLGVIAWSSTANALSTMSMNQNYIPLQGVIQQITFDQNAQFTTADFDGDGNDEILVYEGGTNTLSVAWVNSAVTGGSLYPITGSSPTIWPPATPGPSWNIGSANAFFSAAVTGAQGSAAPIETLCVLDKPSLMLGAITGPGSTSTTPLACQLSLTRLVPAWGTGLLMTAPSTPFTAYAEGDLLTSYQFISQQLDADCNSDIRSVYTNTNKTADFAAYADQVMSMSMPASVTDSGKWGQVKTEIIAELQAVSDVMAYFDNVEQLMTELLAQQISDLWYVAANLGLSQSGSSDPDFTYWYMQAIDAVIWGAAAAVALAGPAGGVAAIVLSVGAAILGAYISAPASTESGQQNVFGQLMPLSNAQSELGVNYEGAGQMNGALEQTVLTDSVLLPLVALLANGPWSWEPTDTAPAVLATQDENRRAFYAMLVPTQFQIMWGLTSYLNLLGVLANAPAQAQYTIGPNTWVLTSNGSPWAYPTLTLLNDVEVTLQTPKYDFLFGKGPWSDLAVKNQ